MTFDCAPPTKKEDGKTCHPLCSQMPHTASVVIHSAVTGGDGDGGRGARAGSQAHAGRKVFSSAPEEEPYFMCRCFTCVHSCLSVHPVNTGPTLARGGQCTWGWR